jgi:hypothetical protein
MNITDYEPTATAIDDTPRPKASQAVAAAKRAAPHDEAPAPSANSPRINHQLLMGIAGVLSVIGVLALIVLQPRALRPIQLQPTAAPAQVFRSVPTAAPAPTSAPIPTIPPTFTPVPTEVVPAAPVQPPMTGRGLTIDSAPSAAEPPAEPSYSDTVGAQAPHCIRTCGDGSYAVAVPPAPPEMLQVIGQQAPHKVR